MPSWPMVPSYKFFMNSDNIFLGELYKFPLTKKKFKNNFHAWINFSFLEGEVFLSII